ncbi:MAG: flagellar basal body rod protein FlgB [Betaproteobacteria bacterium]|nr:flagellar basal body rod protein FlgB [Betaproteobacteria bacterium]
MFSKIDQEVAFVKTALSLRGQRQEILAANLANADTPNYKARDLDFQTALRSAAGAARAGLQMERTASRHLDVSGSAGASSAAGDRIKYRAALQPSLDGNTVDVNVERANFTENALHYQFLMDRAASTFSTLRSAITGEGR